MKWTSLGLLIVAGCLLSEQADGHSFQPCVADAFDQALAASRSLDEQQLGTLQADSSCIDAAAQWEIAYLYGYIAYRRANILMGDQPDEADDALVRAIGKLTDASDRNPDCAVCYALLSSAQGKRIALTPIRGMYLGGRVDENMETAIDRHGDHPVVLLLRANRRLYTPDQFGGDLARAVTLLEQSLERYADADPTPGWDVAEVHFHRAVSAERSERKNLALEHLEAALMIDEAFRAARTRREELAVDQ